MAFRELVALVIGSAIEATIVIAAIAMGSMFDGALVLMTIIALSWLAWR